MTSFIKKIIGRFFANKTLKFYPVCNTQGIALKFYPVDMKVYLLQQRRRGVVGNGTCSEQDF